MRTGHWIAIDFVVAALAALLIMALLHSLYSLMHPGHTWLPVALLVAAGVFVPVALRRRAPMMAFCGLLILAVMLAGVSTSPVALGGVPTPSVPATSVAAVIFLTAAYVLYMVTVTTSRRNGVAALGLVLALMVLVTGAARGHPPMLLAGPFAPVALANVLAWTTGYSVRQRRLYVVRLQQQAATSAVADERLRIARELHDVVAHSMSVIAVQAGYGQYVIDDSPDGAREALGAIQATSREALDEMRRMLGVLRSQDVTPAQDLTGRSVTGTGFLIDGGTTSASSCDHPAAPGGQAPLAPAPGLGNLDRLIKRTCGAGVLVSLEVYGDPRPLPAGLDLSAYRIIQEALTNVVKHAGSGARCTVHLGYDGGVLAIRVTDDGGPSTTLPGYGPPSAAERPVQAAPANAGHGIIGMRERAHLGGGEFTARPLREGGFQVTASLPLPATLPRAETLA
jgi:signal transduction histidine kinase